MKYISVITSTVPKDKYYHCRICEKKILKEKDVYEHVKTKIHLNLMYFIPEFMK